MMISGAIATMGVTCRTTAKGNSDNSMMRDCAKRIANASPKIAATDSAKKVIFSVINSDTESDAQSRIKVCQIAIGPGRI